MAGVTIFALISYFITPESAWLPIDRISHFIDSKGAATETVEEVGSGDNHHHHPQQPEATTSSSGREEN